MTQNYYFEPPRYNALTRQQIWIDGCTHSHDTWCGCNKPIAHFIASVLPLGHKDRDLTIKEILLRDLEQSCHSGGTAATAFGIEKTDTHTEGRNTTDIEDLEKIFSEDALEELIDAAAKDVAPR